MENIFLYLPSLHVPKSCVREIKPFEFLNIIVHKALGNSSMSEEDIS